MFIQEITTPNNKLSPFVIFHQITIIVQKMENDVSKTWRGKSPTVLGNSRYCSQGCRATKKLFTAEIAKLQQWRHKKAHFPTLSCFVKIGLRSSKLLVFYHLLFSCLRWIWKNKLRTGKKWFWKMMQVTKLLRK